MNLKPVIIHGKEISGYFVSECGKVFTSYSLQKHPITKKFCKMSSEKLIELSPSLKNGYKRLSFTVPKEDFIEEYSYSSRSSNSKNVRIDQYIHSVVIKTFRPIDSFPPEQLKNVWNDLPDVAKEWIRDTVIINHKDHDPLNNHITNLEYVTPKQNTRKAVKFYNGNVVNKKNQIKSIDIIEKINVLNFIN